MTTRSGQQELHPAKRKAYQKPTLVKGPLLTKVTAAPPVTVSGNPIPPHAGSRGRPSANSDFRWMIFRAWLAEDAPAWFRSLYLRHGESLGAWLTGKDRARAVVRSMMMPAVRRKLGI